MSEIVEKINSNPKLILNKADENMQTNIHLIVKLKSSYAMFALQSVVELAVLFIFLNEV